MSVKLTIIKISVNFQDIIVTESITWSAVDIYLFKVINENTRATCEIYSKLTIKTPKRRQ